MPQSKLREIVLRLLRETDEPDPRVVADKVLQELTIYDFEDALRQTLPQYVRVMTHQDRPSVPKLVQRSRVVVDGRPEGWSAWVESVQRGDLRKTRWAVGGSWKLLMEFNRADLEEIARHAENLENSSRIKKEGFRRLLAVLESSGASSVGELSDVQIASALAGVEVPE